MAEGKIHFSDGIIELVATETLTRNNMKVTHIILTATAAGSFVFIIGGVTITITTGTNSLNINIAVDRTVNYLELTSGPAGAVLYAFLEKK